MIKPPDTVKYILFGSLACITALALGYFTQGVYQASLVILSIFLVVWIFLILQLAFRRRERPAPKFFSPGDPEQLIELQNRAIAYCDENINYYQGARYSSRRYYIFFQISIAILTGLTPVLVLLSKESSTLLQGQAKALVVWLTILVPAVASIMATTTTIFNFQDDWVQAKKTSESLEALREEYLLGASELFRVDLDTEAKREQQRRALENFILKINELHLQQVDRWASLHAGGQNRDEGRPPSPTALGNRVRGSDTETVPDSQRLHASPQEAGSGVEELIATSGSAMDTQSVNPRQEEVNPRESDEIILPRDSSQDTISSINSEISSQEDASSEAKLI